MKKFVITEEEKLRILEMHETATNRHYLNEQSTTVSDAALKGAISGAIGGSVLPGIGTSVGGGVGMVAGGIGGIILSLLNGSDVASKKVQKIINACGNKFPVTPKTNKIADSIYNAISGVGTDENGVFNALKSSTSIGEFCGVVKSYKDSYGEDLYTALDDDFDSENEWVQIMRPLRDIVLKSQAKKPQQQPTSIPTKPTAKPQQPTSIPTKPTAKPQQPTSIPTAKPQQPTATRPNEVPKRPTPQPRVGNQRQITR